MKAGFRPPAPRWLTLLGSKLRRFRAPLLLVACAVMFRSSISDYNPVPSSSMSPTIVQGDAVWVNKLAYGLRLPLTTVCIAEWATPKRGDIVIALSPVEGTRLVKRIVGIPGDTVEMQDNLLRVNGKETIYLLKAVENPPGGRVSAPAGARPTFSKLTVPANSFFLMGDNRDYSYDSRFFGCVSRGDILGRVGGVLISVDRSQGFSPRFDRFLLSMR